MQHAEFQLKQPNLGQYSELALFPGHVGGEEMAWYRLLAHSHPFPQKPGNLCMFVNGR